MSHCVLSDLFGFIATFSLRHLCACVSACVIVVSLACVLALPLGIEILEGDDDQIVGLTYDDEPVFLETLKVLLERNRGAADVNTCDLI